MQRGLTVTLGTAGATHVRFLFGLPFALILMGLSALVFTIEPMQLDSQYLLWLLIGAVSQILATAAMLWAMRERSFVVTTAVIKTEPVQVAVFASIVLREYLGPVAILAILIATAGVLVMSWPGGRLKQISWQPVFIGVIAGGLFAVSAVGFRGAILSLGDEPFYIRATTTLACGLIIQSALLSAWLCWRQPGVIGEIFGAWRPSLFAGLMGALGSQLWFLAIALQSVAMVRTLALVEILMAQIVSRKIFSQCTTKADAFGVSLIVIGVLVLLNA